MRKVTEWSLHMIFGVVMSIVTVIGVVCFHCPLDGDGTYHLASHDDMRFLGLE